MKRTFSEAVLERKQKRNNARKLIVFRAGLTLIVLAAGIAFNMDRIEHKKQLPTWASFKINSGDGSLESVRANTDDGIPRILSINGEEWEVEKVNHFDDAEAHPNGDPFDGIQAETYCKERLIAYIQTENQANLRNNIWHEVMHAGACLHGGDAWWNSINPTRNEHPGVEHLGEFLGEFSKSNPEFMAWTTK